VPEAGARAAIFWGSGSPFAWRVLMAAELKGIDYDSRRLDFTAREHKDPAYLAINPRGEVPALTDGGTVIAESLAILAYLDARWPDAPLFGTTPSETGAIWQAISTCLYRIEPPAFRVVDAVFGGRVDERTDEVKAAASALREEFADLDGRLERMSWLAGDRVSAADLVAHSGMEFFLRIAARDVLAPLKLGFTNVGQTWPTLGRWRDRMTTIRGYDTAYPPHWRKT